MANLQVWIFFLFLFFLFFHFFFPFLLQKLQSRKQSNYVLICELCFKYWFLIWELQKSLSKQQDSSLVPPAAWCEQHMPTSSICGSWAKAWASHRSQGDNQQPHGNPGCRRVSRSAANPSRTSKVQISLCFGCKSPRAPELPQQRAAFLPKGSRGNWLWGWA